MVRRENRRAGEHLPEAVLSEQIGTSRSPIQAALRHLLSLGVVQQDANRGFFLAKDARDWDQVAAMYSSQPDDPLYLAIAEERHAGRLPDEVSEAELMRHFKVARSTLRKILARISEEGWIRQRVGHRWTFQSMIDSPEAYEESFLFRQAIEPICFLGSSFRYDPAQLVALRREQQAIVDGGYETMTVIELFESNSRFHEMVAEWSNNRFILHSVRRVNRLRRLVEYKQPAKRSARRRQAQEHIGILDAIAKHDLLLAASLMRAHLDDARQDTVHGEALPPSLP